MNFEQEYQILLKWYKERLEETKKIPYKLNGRDGSERNIAENKIDNEYRRKVRVLKKKYSITTQNDAVREQSSIRDTSSTYASGK